MASAETIDPLGHFAVHFVGANAEPALPRSRGWELPEQRADLRTDFIFLFWTT
ncbi:hypothetical protein AtDm6_2045 [Acetobacter tropicalis]|uniref:Uncharacterized protein n=2 Tax=Acetobacter tropicalis TaxID=104102 RepID=F7VCW7_9PROT|nr:hypothetical protein AtDm6_2045 [Acetobacter tropicalis]GAA08212.1 hypothetical protein ATPR_1216 [Acetobacter tropicalis NBRC 101654]